jgi:hypothetical protein
VTNKHVLGESREDRQNLSGVQLHLQSDGQAGAALGTTIQARFDPSFALREHPDSEVDIAVIRASELFRAGASIGNRCVPFDSLYDPVSHGNVELGVGDEVLTIGYPSGLKVVSTNQPLVRWGMLSTLPGTTVVDVHGAISVRGFLVDGGVMPGSSGSPVVLRPVGMRRVGDAVQMQAPPMLLLGVVYAACVAQLPVGGDTAPTLGGLGFAHDAAQVRVAIEQFEPSRSSA